MPARLISVSVVESCRGSRPGELLVDFRAGYRS